MVEQGDILKVEGIKSLVIVISNNRINASNRVIVCPISQVTTPPTLSVPLDDGNTAICDTVVQLDLEARGYSKKGRVPLSKLILMVDMVESMMDCY